MRSARPKPHTLAGAYALDALTGAERTRFERHMARCQQCSREISELRAAATRLAAATACEPPAGLTERALIVAARTRQLPPVTAARRRTGSGVRGCPDGSPSWAAVRPHRARVPRLALVVTAAAVAAAVVSGVSALSTAHRLSEQQQRSHAIAAVLTAPDATMMSAPIATGGTATIVMSRRYHELVFAAAGLPALPPSRCYELWLMGPDSDKPASLLPAPRHGMTGPVTAAGLTSGEHLGLAIEPAGGGPRPGGNVILMVAL